MSITLGILKAIFQSCNANAGSLLPLAQQIFTPRYQVTAHRFVDSIRCAFGWNTARNFCFSTVFLKQTIGLNQHNVSFVVHAIDATSDHVRRHLQPAAPLVIPKTLRLTKFVQLTHFSKTAGAGVFFGWPHRKPCHGPTVCCVRSTRAWARDQNRHVLVPSGRVRHSERWIDTCLARNVGILLVRTNGPIISLVQWYPQLHIEIKSRVAHLPV